MEISCVDATLHAKVRTNDEIRPNKPSTNLDRVSHAAKAEAIKLFCKLLYFDELLFQYR